MSEQLNWAIRRAEGLWWKCKETVPAKEFLDVVSADLRVVWKAGAEAMQRRVIAKLTIELMKTNLHEVERAKILKAVKAVTTPKRTT